MAVLEIPACTDTRALAPAFPGEPTDADAARALAKSIILGEIPDVPPDMNLVYGSVGRTGRLLV